MSIGNPKPYHLSLKPMTIH